MAIWLQIIYTTFTYSKYYTNTVVVSYVHTPTFVLNPLKLLTVQVC